MIAIVVASIVALSFSSVAMYTQNMYHSSRSRSQLSQDAFIVDRYIRKHLTLQMADSMKIFASAEDEVINITDSIGVILRSVRPDSTVDHLALSGGRLVWQVDSNAHFPIDSDVSSLLFTRRSGFSRTLLDINIDLIAGQDSLPLYWLVAVRN